MDLGPEPTRGPARPAEPILPMVNLVFLLLVFLLAATSLGPRPAGEVAPARIAAADRLSDGARPLVLDADGRLALGPLRGAAALDAVAAGPRHRGVALHADRAAPASRVADVAAALAARGLGPVWLVVETPR